MSFINQKQADEIAKWIREHPEEMKIWQREYKPLSQKFIAHEIDYHEFIRKVNELWNRLHERKYG